MNKQIKQIVEMFQPGFGYAPSGRGHYVVTKELSTGDTILLRDDSGLPITFPSSPSVTERMNIIKSLERVGVIVRGEPPVLRAGRPAGRLVRDDLERFEKWNRDNFLATEKVRTTLVAWGLFGPRQQGYVSTAMAHLSGVEVAICDQLIPRFLRGGSLTPGDREPFELLATELATKRNPLQYMYQIVRVARGHDRKEPVVSTTETQPSLDTHEVFERFTKDLRAKQSELQGKIGKMQSELEGIESFINFSGQMEKMMGELHLSFISSSGDQPSGVEVEEKNGGSGTPPTRTELNITEEDRPTGPGAHFAIQKAEGKQKFLDAMSQGGEWTQRELAEEFGLSVQTANTYIRELVEEGTVVMVEPGTGAGNNPSTYGSSEFYQKN